MNMLTVKTTRKGLQKYIETLLQEHQLLDCFWRAKNFCVAITALGARPLHVEKCGNCITIAQYAQINDEFIPDPEIIFRIHKSGRWLPIEAHFGNGGWSNCFNSSELSNLREGNYLQSLADRWSQYLKPNKYEGGNVSQLWGENE